MKNLIWSNNIEDLENKQLLITQSIDDFARVSISSQFVHQSLLKPVTRRSNYSDVSVTANSSAEVFSEPINRNETHNLALNKCLEKSHSSPLPMNTNQSSISNSPIQSAHIINQYLGENRNPVSVYSCVSEVGNTQSTKSVKHSLLNYNRNLRHRTMAKLPPILNRIWRKRLRLTGSREFLLEYDQILPNNHSIQEERYVEQERPLHSHIGLALLALLIFPPVGIIAFVFSIWSLCGQQDRHLSRKFGNTVYWISILAICFSFLLLFTLLIYFTYQYLTIYRIHRPINRRS